MVLVDTATKSARGISVGGTSATIFSLALSPDGKLLAIATRSGIQLWDVSRQRSLATLTLPGTALSVAFSPDGTRLAAVNGALNSLYLWAVPSGRPIPNIFVGVASTVTWSPDGKQMSLGGISQAEQFPLNEHMGVDGPLSTGKVTAEACLRVKAHPVGSEIRFEADRERGNACRALRPARDSCYVMRPGDGQADILPAGNE